MKYQAVPLERFNDLVAALMGLNYRWQRFSAYNLPCCVVSCTL